MSGLTAFLALLLGAWVAIDLLRAIATGRIRGRGGAVTRKGRPEKFRNHLIGDALVLAFCIGVLMWWLFNA